TCLRTVGSRSPNEPTSTRSPAITARATTTSRAVTGVRSANEDPRNPRPPPTVTPASVEPRTYAITVTHQRDPRPRSPSGVMLPSIDVPHGDHVDRRPAATASATPTATSVCTVAEPMPGLISVRPAPRPAAHPGAATPPVPTSS